MHISEDKNYLKFEIHRIFELVNTSDGSNLEFKKSSLVFSFLDLYSFKLVIVNKTEMNDVKITHC